MLLIRLIHKFNIASITRFPLNAPIMAGKLGAEKLTYAEQILVLTITNKHGRILIPNIITLALSMP